MSPCGSIFLASSTKSWQSVYIPNITCGHKLWVMIERMSFLWRVSGFTFWDKSLLLLLRVERRWFGQLVRMPSRWGVMDISPWKEASRLIQGSLKRSYLWLGSSSVSLWKSWRRWLRWCKSGVRWMSFRWWRDRYPVQDYHWRSLLENSGVHRLFEGQERKGKKGQI